MPKCSACGAPTSVQYGRLYTREDPEYRYAARETFVYDEDEPARRHLCNVEVLTERLSRMRTGAVPNTPPVMETPAKRVAKAQEAKQTTTEAQL